MPPQNPSGLIEEPITGDNSTHDQSSQAVHLGTPNSGGLIEEPIAPQEQPSPGLISRAADAAKSFWNWGTSPFSFLQKDLDTDQEAQKKIQAIGDRQAMQAKPGEDAWWPTFWRTFAAGAGRDTAKSLATPFSVAGAAAGAAAEAPGAIGTAGKIITGAGAVPMLGKGAVDTAKGVADVNKQGLTPETGGELAGGVGELAAGGLAAGHAFTAGPSAPTPEYVKSLDHDMAMGTQKYLSDFARNEKNVAGQQIADVDASVDQRFPGGVVPGREIIDKFDSQKNAMFPQGARPAPAEYGRVSHAAGTTPDVSNIEEQVTAPDSNVPPQAMSQLQSEINSGRPLSHGLLQTLRDNGINIPEEPRPWTMAESRQIVSDLMEKAKAMRRANPKGAKLLGDIAREISKSRADAAEAAGFADEHAAANARYAKYMKTFEEGPASKIVRGKNANQVLDGLLGSEGERLRRELAEYDIDYKNLNKAAQVHQTAKMIDKFANDPRKVNQVLSSAGMIAVGNAIGHPFLGLIGASHAARETIEQMLMGHSFADEAGGMKIMPGKNSVPPSVKWAPGQSGPEESLPYGVKSTAGPLGILSRVGAGAVATVPAAQATHYNPKTGQKAYQNEHGVWIDPNTGKPIVY